MPLIAFGLSPEKIGQFLVNGLAVAGGFLVGWVLSGLAAWFLDKRLTRGKTPAGVHRVAKILGGVGVAVLVALVVFGRGTGWNFLGGGGTGDGDSPAPSTGKGGPGGPNTGPPTTDPGKTPPTPIDPTPPATRERVRVTLLGGEAVKNERFYLIDDDATPRTLAETRAALAGRKEAAKLPLGIDLRFAADNALPPTHPAVTLLANWAQQNGVAVTYPAQK